MFAIIVDGKKFLELKRGERNTDTLNIKMQDVNFNDKNVEIGDKVFYSTYDDNLQNEKLVKKVIGDIKLMASGKYRVTFVKEVKK